MRTAKNPGKIRFFRSMRTAKNPSKIFSSGPCGQLKTLQKYFRRGRRRRRRGRRRRRRRCRRRRNFFDFVTLVLHGGVAPQSTQKNQQNSCARIRTWTEVFRRLRMYTNIFSAICICTDMKTSLCR